MFNRTPRSKFCATAAIVLLLDSWIGTIAENIRYNPVSRDVVEGRLGKYTGNNKQRETTLKQMFAEAGCDDQHLSEQPVKGSKLQHHLLAPGQLRQGDHRGSALRSRVHR
jgi:hypothetical protein